MAFIRFDWDRDFDDASPIGISTSMKEDVCKTDYCHKENNDMSNLEKILKQGYFYNIHNEKCHIVHRTEEYIVYKYFSYKKWRYRAESTGEFEAFTESGLAHSAERKTR